MNELPYTEEGISELPTDMRKDIAEVALGNLMVFANVCGFTKLTPRCHGPVAVFFDHNPKRFKLCLMPRDHYKTSVVTISANLKLAVANPEQRILIGNETSTNAERFLRSIRQICERNRLFRALYPGVIPKDTRSVRWNDSELDFVRQSYVPEPTFDTIGMTGAMTSRHYTHICLDDPISEAAIKSPNVMADTIERLGALLNLMVEPRHNSYWLVGTRWGLHDVYSHQMKVYGDKMALLIRSVIEDGEIIFPELIDEETLALMRTSMSPYKFSCLMMNNPRNEDVQDLNIQDARKWEYTDSTETWINLFDSNGAVCRTVKVDSLDITTCVDLAAAETLKSDRNAITTVGVVDRQVIVLDAWAKRCTPGDVIEYLFHIKRRFSPRVFGIEGVAYQKAFKWFLKEDADRRGLYLNVRDVKAIGKKEMRIRGLQPIMARGNFYYHATQQLLLSEMADFPLGEHDDVVDSLSMHLQLFTASLNPKTVDARNLEQARIISKLLGHDTDDEFGMPDYIHHAFTGIIS